MPILVSCYLLAYKSWIMGAEIITKDDLQQFRRELLQDLKQLLTAVSSKPAKEWLKGSEVRKLLGISANTLQNLRVTGKLGSSKIGGIHFYRYYDIEDMMRAHFSKN